MARIKSKQSALQTLSCKFGGMGKHTPLEPMGAEDMCNFRILPNGVLKVRSGYALKKAFSSGRKIRGFWEGTLNGTSYSFAAVGSTVYRLSGPSLTDTVAGTITEGSTLVHFCAFEDNLYLLDGTTIWHYSPGKNMFIALEAYVPLYGYSWEPASYGEVNEELNLLTPRLRVHYYNSSHATIFTLPFYASAVDIVLADGDETTDYTFSRGSNKIIFSDAPTVVEVGITVAINDDLRDAMLAAQLSYIYSRNGENRLLLCDADGRMFVSHTVTTPMLSSCRVYYPDAAPLYFCMDDIFFLGDNAHPVKTFCPLYETLLAFTGDRIWNLLFEKDGSIQPTLAMHGIGCSSAYGAIPYGNGVLAAMNGGIYHITASPARPEDLFLERVSLGIDDKFTTGFTTDVQLFRNFATGEVWMRMPSNTAGEVWVWNTELKEWYRFSGIAATFFLKINGNVGFANVNKIFLFNRSQTTDNGNAIDAYYKSAYLDLASSGAVRRSMNASLYASPSKSDYEVSFETEQNGNVYTLTSPSDATAPRFFNMRLWNHRHRFLRFTISTSAKYSAEFYRLDIYSRP